MSDSEVVARKTVVFVIPSDRGHFDYTVFIAEQLHGRGYAIEYWSPSTAATYAPRFASFHPLHEAGDDRFDRFTRAFCMASSAAGNNYQESLEHFSERFEEILAATFEDPEEAQHGMHGTREALIQMKQRVLRRDVALCIYDSVHIHAWIGQHCADHGVPTLALCPTQIFLRHPENQFTSLPSNLTDEPEYLVVREDLEAVPHPLVYTILPDLLEGCEIPAGRRNVGPVLPHDLRVTKAQEDRFAASGLQAWCAAEDSPIVYVSLGSMIRSGPLAASIISRLLQAITQGPWRVLIAAAPELVEGCIENLRPGHVRAEAWVPQSAVLAHPKVRAFVSHCGATSVNEAVLNGVPIICLPFFDDQYFNAASAVTSGIAVAQLPKLSFTAEAMRCAVRTALESEEVRASVQAASERLRRTHGLAEVVAEAEAAIKIAQAVY
mmetsp:Transcript_131903/g.328918  ORF Transcript_131903/g.328918 Transcript_131903/m.328918 type:complete len:437 (+) Transcript_131903:74-1384(+)|eukprot:CAMPEP_0115302700 /NCGR_PEP_ID=MMETSP0270-20121206/70524_1 /TAXON_ID=71861 /ORGANISM="Scrippsiella trochoidea, Strain CCMP3099" /LENGTH=436 /DNA_ID=CAMNT_0002720647 /DNA_START=53 /DNA_END=1363 /DNA_ORIENTATION=+